ncbi:MAG TPA: sulfotransferase [Solirubrobacteraceae bacterium]|nr:sulfotransferase [Solirubrobacteraceae bacterium]
MAAVPESFTGTRAASVRFPEFFVVGHHKCGTTALYEMLKLHPQIFLPRIKEPKFFASDLQPRFQPPRGHKLPRTVEEYLALFADARPDQRTGEASPSYLFSHTAADAIADVQPDARIVAILREPASFLRSLHLQLLRSHVEVERDLLEAISLAPARAQGRRIPRRSHVPQLLQYPDHVRYVEQLRRYHARFPREQVHVIVYDDFRDDNETTVRAVLRFLEVSDEHPVQQINVKQTTRTIRSHQLDDVLRSLSLGRSPAYRAARAAVKSLTPRELRLRAFRTARRRAVLREAPPVDEDALVQLRRRFEPEVHALSEYLDRDLVALWGYDKLG